MAALRMVTPSLASWSSPESECRASGFFAAREDPQICRVTSGMQASCSPCSDGIWKSGSDRRSRKEGTFRDSGIRALRSSGSSKQGFHPVQASWTRANLLSQMISGAGWQTIPPLSKTGVLRTNLWEGERHGIPELRSSGSRQHGGKKAVVARSSRRHSAEERPLHPFQCSFTKAFSSMVLMLKTLQTYALEMRSMLFYEDFQSVAHVIHREMQASLLWLFQQVFACTPMLMVAVMVLFSDFTAHASSSLTEVELEITSDRAVAATVTRVPLSVANVFSAPAPFQPSVLTQEGPGSVTPLGGDCGGRGGRPKFTITPEDDGESLRSTISAGSHLLSSDLASEDVDSRCQGSGMMSGELSLSTRLTELKDELVREDSGLIPAMLLDKETRRNFVAPVAVRVESDDYLCFHRTELEYQLALAENEANPMILANYAQFLYTVRHDLDRSEDYFLRALRADPTDGEIIGRFATFLWLGRKDRPAAERAFKAAIASSPDNPYFSGSYAHFLWHSGDEEATSSNLYQS